MPKQEHYVNDKNVNEEDVNEEDQYSRTIWRWLGLALLVLALLLLGFLIRDCTGPTKEIEVTRIVSGGVTEVPVTTIVTDTVEVTRIVTEIEVTEVPVTRVITATVETEVTRIVEKELPVTRIVTETEQIVVTKIVPIPPKVTVTPGNGRGCTRFDLEIGRNKLDGTPEDGIYIMQELPGHRLAIWSAQQGWLDSGWLRNLPLSRETVHVQVFFYPTAGGDPIQLEILNPAPGTPYGWLANDVCHAVELQFPN